MYYWIWLTVFIYLTAERARYNNKIGGISASGVYFLDNKISYSRNGLDRICDNLLQRVIEVTLNEQKCSVVVIGIDFIQVTT